ncbi:hypothetical protein V6N13_036975 [Hibiscus sabdariffa]
MATISEATWLMRIDKPLKATGDPLLFRRVLPSCLCCRAEAAAAVELASGTLATNGETMVLGYLGRVEEPCEGPRISCQCVGFGFWMSPRRIWDVFVGGI